MRKVGLLAIALVLALTGQARSQASRTSELLAQRARTDTLNAYWLRAKARLDAFDDSVTKSRALLDTIAVGHLRVLVEKEIHQRIQPAVAASAARMDSSFGSAATLLERHWFVVRQYRDKTDTISIAAIMKPGHQFPMGREIDLLWGPVSDTLVRDGLRAGAVRLLSTELDTAFGRWLGSELNPDTVTTFQWTQARLELVSSAATVAQRCYNGDINACRITLMLDPVADRATEWFDAAGRRKFFEQIYPNYFTSPLEKACRAGDDAACISAIRQLKWFQVRSLPATGVLTSSVTQTALRIGGHDALLRLLESSAPPAQALADAAGVPLDSVFQVWQRNAREARLPSQDVSFGIAATSLLWIALCGALSLRSSRWR